ncbi:C1 family peptidase [uncultured Algibacter sp.]|uniref:C1 family peptidase n=1 Tax=uncultured Algibacter sp. TaxID=298659 RepID=UPI00263175F2|nr:C1 family peptidase [uncultured Algibacter sp.]
MKNNILILVLFILTFNSQSQSYEFKTVIDLETTNVISQGNTGTCWSFSTSSFLESEIIRLTGKNINLSEMYNVRNAYVDKSWNYIMRQGKAQFGEGGLAHDVLNSIEKHGLVPNSAYSGLHEDTSFHDHSEVVAILKSTIDAYLTKPGGEISSKWKDVTEKILDVYLGKKIDSFSFEGVIYTPKSFLKYTEIAPNNYVSITSFTHEPFNSKFILNIPDNFSNGSFYNVSLDDLVSITNNALEKGYSIELDCDVSEKTFSAKHGIAVIPEKPEDQLVILETIKSEKKISQEFRQKEFENQNTTDDHLMHITGLLKDQKGHTYYKVKNSWGSDSKHVNHGGYIYMSENYFRLKTISITIHKNAIPKNIIKNLKILQ